MSDLIERLRYPAFEHAGTAVMVEAADRIEVLEAALREAIRALRWNDAVDEANKAKAALAPEQDK